MRWTRQRFARDGIAGRVGERPVSDHQASGREMLQRTAKSCGLDAPTLASSSRSCVGPTGLRQDISVGDGGKRARSPGRARRKPLKPLRAGTSGDSGVLVVTRVRSTNTKCTRGRGCHGHPAFPTPSEGGRFINASGALRREAANVCLAVRVFSRHCERSEAIHSSFARRDGLLRCARNDGRKTGALNSQPLPPSHCSAQTAAHAGCSRQGSSCGRPATRRALQEVRWS